MRINQTKVLQINHRGQIWTLFYFSSAFFFSSFFFESTAKEKLVARASLSYAPFWPVNGKWKEEKFLEMKLFQQPQVKQSETVQQRLRTLRSKTQTVFLLDPGVDTSYTHGCLHQVFLPSSPSYAAPANTPTIYKERWRRMKKQIQDVPYMQQSDVMLHALFLCGVKTVSLCTTF